MKVLSLWRRSWPFHVFWLSFVATPTFAGAPSPAPSLRHRYRQVRYAFLSPLKSCSTQTSQLFNICTAFVYHRRTIIWSICGGLGFDAIGSFGEQSHTSLATKGGTAQSSQFFTMCTKFALHCRTIFWSIRGDIRVDTGGGFWEPFHTSLCPKRRHNTILTTLQ